ncbi:MAG: EcsC family protein [Deltaproteobacteria bacterium]|nr:EcsC family protein [Deltaproteobacteria bacterium]
MSELGGKEISDLKHAKSLLEYPSVTARIAGLIGTPVEKGFKMLPAGWQETVGEASHAALLKGLELAIRTTDSRSGLASKDWFHKLMVTASGAAGGAIGLPALPVELPISTCLILRSVAEIARNEGHDLTLLSTRMSCLEVLALGGKKESDNAGEFGYWAIRSALGKAVSEAAAFIAERGLIEEGAPPIVRLVITIASRFSIVVSEEVAAKSIPVVGSAGGALINYLFIDHFQNMAKGHFIVKRLEKIYGQEAVKKAYDDIGI